MPQEYLFADTDLAARRLEYLASVFGGATQKFLAAVAGCPELVVDLGCGPGCTTHLLAEVTQCDQAVGIDKSEAFIERAEQTQTDVVSFRQGDVTEVPFAAGAGDLLYCRFLLAHLQNPFAAIERWSTQLRPQGQLLIEEVEWIHMENEIFVTYLDMVTATMAAQDNRLYLGPELDQWEQVGPLRQVSSQVGQVVATTQQVATMFHMNIQTWKHNNFAKSKYGENKIAELEDELKILREGTEDHNKHMWGMRQVALQKF